MIMNKKWFEGELEIAISLIKEGKRYNEIGVLLNRTSDSVRRKLSSNNIYYETYNPKPSIICKEGEKYCTTCNNIKLIEGFNKNKSKKDGLNSICSECSNKRSIRYYSENTEHHKKVIRKRVNKIIKENRLKIFNYYQQNPCVDCGNNNPIVLEFDHKDGVTKVDNISYLVNSGAKWSTIEKEIEKCDVRCANCHRIRTAKQFNWYKGLI